MRGLAAARKSLPKHANSTARNRRCDPRWAAVPAEARTEGSASNLLSITSTTSITMLWLVNPGHPTPHPPPLLRRPCLRLLLHSPNQTKSFSLPAASIQKRQSTVASPMWRLSEMACKLSVRHVEHEKSTMLLSHHVTTTHGLVDKNHHGGELLRKRDCLAEGIAERRLRRTCSRKSACSPNGSRKCVCVCYAMWACIKNPILSLLSF